MIINCPTTSSGGSLPRAGGGGLWGGCPRGSPLKAGTKGFPLEQPVFNEDKGPAVESIFDVSTNSFVSLKFKAGAGMSLISGARSHSVPSHVSN